jgi:Flp pilus assembly protein TadD
VSLLNDALRKRRSEQQGGDNLRGARVLKSGRRTNRVRPWIGWGCAVALAAVACGGWVYWTASDASSNFAAVPRPADAGPARGQAEPPSPAAHAGTSASAGVATVQSSAAAPPVLAAQATPVQTPPGRIEPPGRQQPAVPPRPVKPPAPLKAPAARKPAERHGDLAQGRRPSASKAPPARAAAPSRTAQERRQGELLYQKARQYHRRGLMGAAIALYQEALKADPGHAKARFNLAAAYLQTEAYAKAYPILADLYRKDPANQQVMLNLAIAHIGCGRFQEALELLDQAAQQPHAPLFEIAFHKAVAYSRLNQPQTALAWYKRAEALRPDDPRLLFNLAVLSDQQQHYAEAADYYLKYIQSDPQIDALQEKQIRRRIRILQAYHTGPDPGE